jgi:NAD(P)-dependent dehydrogenase (short-subunit alcohol dehydrogenase family)
VDRLSPEGVFEDVQRELAPFVHMMPLVLPGMYERHWGRVLGLAMHPTRLSPAYAYNLGKAARLQAFLLAYEQAWREGVTMNVIAPGPVGGIASLEEAIAQCDHGAAWEGRSNVSPQDVAEGVAFLCSEAGRFITGCVLPYAFTR